MAYKAEIEIVNYFLYIFGPIFTARDPKIYSWVVWGQSQVMGDEEQCSDTKEESRYAKKDQDEDADIMKTEFVSLRRKLTPFVGKIWCCGPLSSGVTAVGLTYCVAVTLSLLFYLSTVTLTQFITVIVVVFSSVVVLLVNLLLLYGSARQKPHLLLPWLAVTIPGTLALLIYTAVQFHKLQPYQAVYVGGLLLSTYFCAVVVTQLHKLRATGGKKKPKTLEGGKEEQTEAVLVPGEDTLLVELSPGLPRPEEVIDVEKEVKLSANNPFLEDVFKVKALQRAAKQARTTMDIRSDFTPFKSKEEKAAQDDKKEVEVPAKLRIFLPTTGNDAEESDFDFSFNDPVFDSSLVAASHQDPME